MPIPQFARITGNEGNRYARSNIRMTAVGRKRPMTKRSNSPKLVNIDCSLQANVFVSFILLAIDDALSINLHLPR